MKNFKTTMHWYKKNIKLEYDLFIHFLFKQIWVYLKAEEVVSFSVTFSSSQSQLLKYIFCSLTIEMNYIWNHLQ